MLVVVKDRDGHAGLQLFLDVEAVRGLDVLQVYAAEGGLQQFDRADELVRVGGVHLDVEHVDIGEAFEQDRLALHDGIAGQGADVPQPQHGGPVGNHRDKVAPVGVFEGCIGVLFDHPAGGGHAGRVGQAQVGLAEEGFGGHDLDLAGVRLAVVAQRLFVVGHAGLLIKGMACRCALYFPIGRAQGMRSRLL